MGTGISKCRYNILVLAAALVTAQAALAADPIKIGVTTAESPPGSVSQGIQVRDGIQVASDMINKTGGLLGRPVELLFEDTQGIPEKARAAVEKLITRDKVVAIVGEHNSSTALAAIEVAHRYHIPYVNTNGWADAVREKLYPEVFNPNNYNSRVGVASADMIKSLGLKRVVALVENTDFGVGLGKLLGNLLSERSPGIQYKYVTLDRAGKEFLPALLALKADPPDMVVNIMIPPAAYILLNQMYEQGIAPSPKTWLYDLGNADYPDFWQNVGDSAKYMLEFALYHPKMSQPELGKNVAAAYKAKTGNDANRMLFQAADSLFVVAEAIKVSGSTEPEAVIKALEGLKYTGTRGEITFSSEKGGFKFQQWINIPYLMLQITAVNQTLGDMTIVQDIGQPFDAAKLLRPK
jgi:branched-chain amino acid transport system substrate-binding protein